MHPKTWPIIKELSGGMPRLGGGNMMVDFHGKPFHPLHSGREGAQKRSMVDGRHYFIQDELIRCNDLVVFFYLTDLFPGDGGLMVLPGSHKSHFAKPKDMYYTDTYYIEDYVAEEVLPGVANLTARAGDVLICSELLIHGALTWKPRDRERRLLTMRYGVQHTVTGSVKPFSEEIRARLSPETLELIEVAPYNHIKEIVKKRCGDSYEASFPAD